MHVPGRLDLAERRGHARGVQASREEDAERDVRPPMPLHRTPEEIPEDPGNLGERLLLDLRHGTGDCQ